MYVYDNELLVMIVGRLSATMAAIAEDLDEDDIDEAATVAYRMVDYNDKIAWVLENFALHSSIDELAAAALKKAQLDTLVREELHEAIMNYA